MSSDPSQSGVPGFYARLLDFIRTHQNAGDIERHVEALAAVRDQAQTVYFGPEVQTAGHRAYDAVIARILSSVLRATSREALLDDVLTDLADATLGSASICLFVLERYSRPNSGKRGSLTLMNSRKLNDDLWENYGKRVLPRFEDSALLEGVLTDERSIDLWHTSYIPSYGGEFDTLVNAQERKKKDRRGGYWISAVPLRRGEAGRANRALFALYPDKGTDIQPKVPAGANQDLRVFHFLSLAYQLLNHQLLSVAEQVHDERQHILTSLAPGILNHEIGTQVVLVDDYINMTQQGAVRDLRRRYPGDDAVAEVASALEKLATLARRLARIADAFNNMEKRRAREVVTLDKVLREAVAMTHHRLGSTSCRLEWSADELDVQIETDPALLLHLLLNVIVNATNAFAERPAPAGVLEAPRRISVRCQAPAEAPSRVRVALLNNGPPIPEENLERIFEKGFTTRPHGHGQGLYICRLIAEALGGGFRALLPSELPPDFAVGFHLDLPRRAERQEDLLGERIA